MDKVYGQPLSLIGKWLRNVSLSIKRSASTGQPSSAMESRAEERNEVAVDGGRAWVVLAAMTLMSFLTFGSTFASGTYFAYLEDTFQASKTQLGLLFALIGGIALIFGSIFTFRDKLAFKPHRNHMRITRIAE